MTAFFTNLRNGALPALTFLDLVGNNIGDEGLKVLSEKLTIGALPALKELVVDDGTFGTEHPKLKHACAARGIRLS